MTIAPNLWAGVGLVRGGAGTALVGSHAEVADRIEEYASLGVSEFILSGYPHLEEAYWFGEGVLPELERRGRWAHPAPATLAPQTMTPFAPTHAASASTVSASTVSASTVSASTAPAGPRPADPASKVAP